MPINDQRDAVLTLNKQLSMKIIDENMIQIIYQNKNKEGMDKTIRTISNVYSQRIRVALKKIELGSYYTHQKLMNINTGISKQYAVLAKLQSRYTIQHSEVIFAKNEIKKLQDELNNIFQYSPNQNLEKNYPTKHNENHRMDLSNDELNPPETNQTKYLSNVNSGNLNNEHIDIIELPSKIGARLSQPLILYLFGGLIASLLLNASIIIFAIFLNTSIRLRSQIENISGMLVLSRIPAMET